MCNFFFLSYHIQEQTSCRLSFTFSLAVLPWRTVEIFFFFFFQEHFLWDLVLKWLSISLVCLRLNPRITMCIQEVSILPPFSSVTLPVTERALLMLTLFSCLPCWLMKVLCSVHTLQILLAFKIEAVEMCKILMQFCLLYFQVSLTSSLLESFW